jgi:hypothetical protein
VSQQPIGVAERSKWVGAEVSSLQPGRARAGDAQFHLEMLVQCVDKPVGEALGARVRCISTITHNPRGRTQRKNRIVTKQSGKIDARRVSSAALVR